MRILVFFDLPVTTPANRRDYARFRKQLIKDGFVMLQQSVYVKLAANQNAASAYVAAVKKARPPAGVVQTLVVTEKQFQKMEMICGEFHSDVILSDERLLIL